MAKYFIRRFLQLVVVAFIISVLCFMLVHLLPGDPSVIILGPNDTAHNRAVLLQELGLNKPLYQQYFTWLGGGVPRQSGPVLPQPRDRSPTSWPPASPSTWS